MNRVSTLTAFQVFKHSHEQLEALLPPFDDLPTAVAASCHAMNAGDGAYDEGMLQASLDQALDRLSTADAGVDPLHVLSMIRTWALECLRDEHVLAEISTPLASPSLETVAEGTYAVATRALSARRARGILANAFFTNCRDPMESHKHARNAGGLDWRQLLMAGGKPIGLERFQCHLLYFVSSCIQENAEDDDKRTIVFERIHYHPIDFLQSHANLSARQVGIHVNIHDHDMEHPPRPMSAFCNFANQNFGCVRSCTLVFRCCLSRGSLRAVLSHTDFSYTYTATANLFAHVHRKKSSLASALNLPSACCGLVS